MERMSGGGGSAAVPGWVPPMLAKPDGGRLRSGPEWAYEYKLDGYRALMRVAPDGTTTLTSRNGIDFTAEFPTLVGVLDGESALIDGEIVVYNDAGQVDFGLMQERRGRYRKHSGSAVRDEVFDDVPVRFLAFDLLRLGDTPLLRESYDRRRALLARLPMPDPHLVSVVPAVTFDELAADRLTPATLLDRLTAEGHEGLIAKLRSSPYLPGERPGYWLKHPLVQTREVVVCGWRPGKQSFGGTLGGLLLGGHDPDTGDLVYLGDVGTGFTHRDRDELRDRLSAMERRTHPFAAAPPREDVTGARWVEPALVGEVRFRQFTKGAGRLRHTSWRGLREDRDESEVLAPRASRPAVPERPPAPAPTRVAVRVGDRRLALSNLDKVMYPEDGFTKAEVIDYYSRIAPVLLPHLAGRPVTFIRFPNGVGGQRFFQKNVPAGAPAWLRSARLPSTGSRGRGESVDHPLIDDLPALVWAANLASLELHVPQWTIGPDGTRGLPDRLVFDLDPGPGTTVVECARVAERLRDLLVADGLAPVAKTSGSKGMQLYAAVRVARAERTSAYAKALAERLARETPDLVTARMTKALRPGKVLVDWSQNNPAKTTVAPYSLRGRDEPTASTPVGWDEVRACLRAEDLRFTAGDVLERVARTGDLFAPLADTAADLPEP
ncbi:DNA ligase D [Umezawaea tangerina]|uniref:DNA ligase (ATP) n=1 Tax=Umezawaea tangerina TaxID=84725 RepID=A0A2T0SZ25_9PSEU|nr:DNA ligase D [Umezawaea tangerina]PRY38657.1 bifunctional non-homologous end joining protein LigD [Umezawaea tangerina]